MHLKLLLQWSSEVLTSIQNREAVFIHMGALFSTKINAKGKLNFQIHFIKINDYSPFM